MSGDSTLAAKEEGLDAARLRCVAARGRGGVHARVGRGRGYLHARVCDGDWLSPVDLSQFGNAVPKSSTHPGPTPH